MSFIGIDLGNKRCGLAIELEGIAFPHSIVTRVSLVNEVKKLIKTKKVTKIIVGLPYDLYGKNNKQLNKTKKFIGKVEYLFPNIEIIGVDERYTTFEADNILTFLGEKNTKGKKDAISAQLILESYLDINKNKL